ncbi:MAG: hypothetical protein ACRDE2_07930, partial [Chitinophagaceae bacterium]
MKINKKIKIALLSALGIAVLLIITLLVHVTIMVKEMRDLPDATIQMARADFIQPVDSMSALQIEDKVMDQPGVKSTYFNSKDYTLVYTFDNRVDNAQNIYNHAIKNDGFNSSRFIVSASD